MKSLLLLLSIPLLSIGQMATNIVEHKTCYLKYDFASIAGDGVTNSSGVQLGIEYEMNDNLGVEQDLMYIFTVNWQNNGYHEVEVEKINGIKSITELRFYIRKDQKINIYGAYICPNIILQYTKATRKGKDENHIEYDYLVNRYVLACHGKFGYQSALYRRVFFDIGCGLGLRYISSNSEGKKDSFSTTNEYPYSKNYDNGAKWFPSATFSLKIAYKL